MQNEKSSKRKASPRKKKETNTAFGKTAKASDRKKTEDTTVVRRLKPISDEKKAAKKKAAAKARRYDAKLERNPIRYEIKDNKYGFRVVEGIVNKNKDYIGIWYGDDERLVALLAPGAKKKFNLQLLIDSDKASKREKAIITHVRNDVDEYILFLGGEDPWNYAQYHCRTTANMYSNVHWGLFRGTGKLAKTACERCGEPISGRRLCDDCRKAIKEQAAIVAAGGVYFECKDCGVSGVIMGSSEFAKHARKHYKAPAPEPFKVKFSKANCPKCGPAEARV